MSVRRPRKHRAPSLPPIYVVLLVLLFAAGTIARGWGYVTAEPGRSMSQVVEQGLSNAKLSPTDWGIALMATGIAIFVTYAVRIHVLVFFAHGIAACVYLSVTVGLLQASTELGTGWPHAVPTALAMGWHALIAKLTGPLPPRAHVSEGDPCATDE